MFLWAIICLGLSVFICVCVCVCVCSVNIQFSFVNIRGSKALVCAPCGSLKHCVNGYVILCMHRCFYSSKTPEKKIFFYFQVSQVITKSAF